jgi:hypothetical protein
MKQMETGLETKLDWIAVDHHNTGHPHTHIMIRGVTGDGKTLNIAGDYIAYGIRERASEIVTRELGRQTELEVTKQLERELYADRFTRLDRMLIAEQQGNEFTDLRPDQHMRDTFRQNRALLIERARKLERMGLATGSRPANGLYRQRLSRRCGSLVSAATSSRPCTGRWSAKGWRRTAIPRATSCIERTRPSASSAACSTKGLAATRWANGSGC